MSLNFIWILTPVDRFIFQQARLGGTYRVLARKTIFSVQEGTEVGPLMHGREKFGVSI